MTKILLSSHPLSLIADNKKFIFDDDIRYRLDGTEPTETTGHFLPSNTPLHIHENDLKYFHVLFLTSKNYASYNMFQ